MGDYKFTFTDGSEAIAHHGTKGMKWGVWNEETRARRTGAATTPRGIRKDERGFARYEKKKAKTEQAAERYVTKPSAVNRYSLNRAVFKELGQNDQTYRDWTNKSTLSIVLGGGLGYGAYNLLSKKQKQRAAVVNQHFNETLSTRIDDASIRVQKMTGMKAVEKVVSASAEAKVKSKQFEEKAKSYEPKKKNEPKAKTNSGEQSFEARYNSWKPEKQKAYDKAVEAENKLQTYREWNRDFDPKYSEKKAAQLKKEVDLAYAKFDKL